MAITTASGGELRRRPRLSLAQEAYESILEAIVDRRLLPGTRLLIRSLAEDLEMSTTPVREALGRAAGQRLVLHVTNRGCTVAPLLDHAGYDHLFDVRRLLEEHAVRAAVPARESVRRLQELSRDMEDMDHGDHFRAFHDFNQADREFHLTLVGLAANPFLEQAWTELHFHLHLGRLYTGAGIIDYSDALREHAAISRSLSDGDLITAAALAVDHIRSAQRRLRRLLPPADSPPTPSNGRGCGG